MIKESDESPVVLPEFQQPLHDASASATADVIRALVVAGATVDHPSRSGEAPLHVAARAGNLDAVRGLLTSGADANTRISSGSLWNLTALHIAAREGRHEVISALIDKGADTNAKGIHTRTPLDDALDNYKLESVRALLKCGASLPNRYPRRAVWGLPEMMAARLLAAPDPSSEANLCLSSPMAVGSELLISVILAAGAQLDSLNRSLHNAAKHGTAECIDELIRAGAEVNTLGSWGQTPLHSTVWAVGSQATRHLFGSMEEAATSVRAVEKINLLVSAGADVNSQDKHGQTPLHHATHTSPKVILSLIAGGASVNASNEHGLTPLHLQWPHRGLVELLRHNYCQIDHTGYRYEESVFRSLYSRAAESVSCIRILVQSGARLNVMTDTGETPLHLAAGALSYHIETLVEDHCLANAAEYGIFDSLDQYDLKKFSDIFSTYDVETIEILVRSGAHLNVPDKQGNIPLSVASENSSNKVVSFLIDRGADVFSLNMFGESPLHSAARPRLTLWQALSDHLVKFVDQEARATITKLIASGVNVSLPDKFGKSPLHVAAESCIPDRIAVLLSNGADVNARDQNGITPLHLIASNYHRYINSLLKISDEIIETAFFSDNYDYLDRGTGFLRKSNLSALSLVETAGADVEVTDKNGRSPLHHAALNGSWSCVRDLLELSANVRSPSDYGDTPLHFAAQRKLPDQIARYVSGLTIWTGAWLVGQNGNARPMSDLNTFFDLPEWAIPYIETEGKILDKWDLSDETYFPDDDDLVERMRYIFKDLASTSSHIIALLIGRGARIDSRNHEGDTALHNAAEGGLPVGIGSLVVHGADLSSTDGMGNTPIHRAARAGRVKNVAVLVTLGARVDSQNQQGETPLHVASKVGKTSVIRALVGLGANVEAIAIHGETAVALAAEHCQPESIDALAAVGAEVNRSNHNGDFPIHLAARVGDSACISVLTAFGADVHAKDREGQTPIRLAMESGSMETVLALVTAGARVRADDGVFEHSILQAAWAGRHEIIAKVVVSGADVNGTNSLGETPLFLAVRSKKPEAVAALLLAGADVNLRNHHGDTPLHVTATSGNSAIVDALVDAGAQVDAAAECVACDGPVHRAARSSNQATLSSLIKAGADIDAVDGFERTALHYAALLGNTECMHTLVGAGAKLNGGRFGAWRPGLYDELGYEAHDPPYRNRGTPLHDAARGCQLGSIKVLLEAGISVDLLDEHIRTPLHYAARHGTPEIIATLLSAGADPDAVDGDGRTPAEWANQYDRSDNEAALEKFLWQQDGSS